MYGGTSLNCRKSQSVDFSKYAAQPRGYYPPYCWIMPRAVRDMASRKMTFISIGASANGCKGLGFPATANISISSLASGALVRWGISNATIVLSGTGDILAIMGIAGNASFEISSSLARGAIGWISASGNVTLDATGDGALAIVGVGTTTFSITGSAYGTLVATTVGTANFSVTADGVIVGAINAEGLGTITVVAEAAMSAKGHMSSDAIIELAGTMISYGIGYMQGTTEDLTEMTPATIASAVWKYAVEGQLTAEQISRILLAVQTGKTTIVGEDPVVVKFRDQADSKDRVIGEMSDSERVNVTLDGS
jgi:hypothetical protein